MGRPPPPDRVAISTMTPEWVKLYRNFPPPGQPISVGVQPFPVEDSTPEDEDIVWEVRRILRDRSGGLSGMRLEHLRQWLIDATWDDTPDTINWMKVVAIVQAE